MIDVNTIESFVNKNFCSYWGNMDKNLVLRYCNEYQVNPNKKEGISKLLDIMKIYFIQHR